ncbi:MAG: hypothetical protein P8Z30_10420 [Acidobacteriota bacterium]
MRIKFAIALSIAMLGVTVFVLPAYAQRGFLTGRGSGMRAGPRAPFRGGQHVRGGYLTGPRGRRGYGSYRGYRGYGGYGRSGAFIYPYWYPSYYSDYYSQPAPAEAPPTRVVVVENTQPRAEAPPPPPPPDALVLERQGDRWVRITDSGRTEVSAQTEKKGPAEASSLRPASPLETAEAPPAKLPPAVLVFRDGHKEEITRYAIIGGTIYTSADYWSQGSWTKRVSIADLNIPATLKLNRERGTNFSLPSAPGVIAIRP